MAYTHLASRVRSGTRARLGAGRSSSWCCRKGEEGCAVFEGRGGYDLLARRGWDLVDGGVFLPGHELEGVVLFRCEVRVGRDLANRL